MKKAIMKNVEEMYLNPPRFVKVFCRDCRYFKIFQRDGRRLTYCWLNKLAAKFCCEYWQQRTSEI
jgi:hypothetical protein